MCEWECAKKVPNKTKKLKKIVLQTSIQQSEIRQWKWVAKFWLHTMRVSFLSRSFSLTLDDYYESIIFYGIIVVI